jgi:hypothetical protein
VSPTHLAIDISQFIESIEEYDSSPEGLLYVDNIGWVATERDVSQVVKILDKCGAKIIELARRFGLQFDHTKT